MTKIEKENEFTIIWNDDKTLGLRFKEGESMQLYDSTVITDFQKLESKDGIDWLDKEIESLKEFAKEKYPFEFSEMP